MAALTGSRAKTIRWGQEPLPALWEPPVKGATTLYAGSMIVIDTANGFATKGRTATGLLPLGAAESLADNSAGADGAILVKVLTGCWKWDNSTSGDLITQANVGQDCFIVDDHTVAATSNSSARSKAGKVMYVDTDGGVWVLQGPAFW